jgi:glutathione synthase
VKYLIVADPVSRWQPVFDTSLRTAAELLSRGIEVDYVDLLATDALKPAGAYLESLPVQKVLHAEPEEPNFLGLGPKRLAPVTDYAVILQRKDPPVDERFRAYMEIYAQAPRSILQINDPSEAIAWSEHLLPMRFPEFSIPTQVCRSPEELVCAVREQVTEAVLKPVNECSGIGVSFLRKDVPEPEILKYWEEWRPAVVVQPYQEEITKSGDLRILVFNRQVLGSVLRVPRQGSRLANLHQGASSAKWTPTKRQLEAAEAISADLTPRGLYLLGLDFIGDLVSEINITSPSALVQINQVMGKRTEVELVDGIEALRKSR